MSHARVFQIFQIHACCYTIAAEETFTTRLRGGWASYKLPSGAVERTCTFDLNSQGEYATPRSNGVSSSGGFRKIRPTKGATIFR
jgi:hypothetical protein